ncbi:MAG: hypothetical protein HY981_04210 [Candidatus Magasanikbacteria bacterium]|nr:hypothetical protein [Candidatus Magasanikbacteria bacterium]
MTSTYRYRHPSRVQNFLQFMHTFKLAIIIVIALLGAGYIAEANFVSSHGIQIRALQNDITQEQHDLEQLEIQVATSQSMNTLETRVQSLHMVTSERPVYISIPSGAVALR